MQNYNRQGKRLTWRNPGPDDVSGGALVVVGDMVGVAALDIVAGAVGALVVEGVFSLPKGDGEIQQGQRVYLEASGKLSAAPAAAVVGLAWETAPAGAKTVSVKINV